jgi:hypothetical protein
MLDCKPVDTSIVQNYYLVKYPDQVPTNRERYQKLMRKLIYFSYTRPNIVCAVNLVSQFMQNPSEVHIEVALRVLRYLKSSPGREILFSKNDHLNIIGYTDADWVGNLTDRKSTSGYLTFVEGNLVT